MGRYFKSYNDVLAKGQQSPSFSDWAEMQQKELNERAGDGYSSWEHAVQSVGGIPEMVSKGLSNAYQSPEGQADRQATLLEQMRAISDKQKQAKDADSKYELSPAEQDSTSLWERMKTRGIAP